MKITIVQGAFLPVPPVLGGATEKMWFALSKHFAQQGHEVVYVSRTYLGMPTEEWIAGVFHRRVSGYTWPSSGIVKLKFLDLIYTLRAASVVPLDSDIVVTNTFWAPVVLPSSLRKKCIIDVARIPKGQLKLYWQTSRFRANSNYVAEAIKQEISAKLYKKVVKIPNPLPFDNLPEVNYNSKKPVILYAGRVHPEKGIDLLVKAFNLLDSNWTLKVVGPTDTDAGGGGVGYLESLKQLADGHKVDFTGPIHDINQLNQFYAEASIFVYPSVAEQGETFGLAPLEAMAWGCVPIVSNLACFGDFIKHERNGLVFDHRSKNASELLRSCIEQLQNNYMCWLDYSLKALKVRQSHSTSFIASQFLDEFRRMIDERTFSKIYYDESLLTSKSL